MKSVVWRLVAGLEEVGWLDGGLELAGVICAG